MFHMTCLRNDATAVCKTQELYLSKNIKIQSLERWQMEQTVEGHCTLKKRGQGGALFTCFKKGANVVSQNALDKLFLGSK